MRRNNLVMALGILIVLQILDVITTVIGVNRGGEELNPIAGNLLEVGQWFLMAVKLTIATSIALITWASGSQHIRVVWIANGIYFLVVLSNTLQLVKL